MTSYIIMNQNKKDTTTSTTSLSSASFDHPPTSSPSLLFVMFYCVSALHILRARIVQFIYSYIPAAMANFSASSQ